MFYPYSIKINTFGGSCSNINDPYTKLCIPDIVKSINVKVFDLMQRINETRQIIWHETCKCACRLTSSVCNGRQIWNEDECRCRCKDDLIDKMVSDKGFSWNPTNCDCECDKPCGIGEYLDYKSCVCKSTLVDKLIEECTSIVDGDKIYNETLNTISPDECNSCALYIVLFAVFLTTNVIIGSSFVYFYWYKKSKQLNFKKKMFLMLSIQQLKH